MTNSVNRVENLGNLTRKPEVKYTPSGTAYSRFTIACNYSYRDEESGEWKTGCDFVSVLAWGRTAEVAHKCLDKGAKVFVESKVRTSSWDGKDGKKQYSQDLVVKRLVFVDGKMPEVETKDTDVPAGEHAEVDHTDVPF